MSAPPRPYDDPHRSCTHRRYQMTCEEYDALRISQGGVCGVCAGTNGTRLAIDHDHALGTWAVRGLVCHYCNTGPLSMTDRGLWREAPMVKQYKASAWHLTHRTERRALLAYVEEK